MKCGKRLLLFLLVPCFLLAPAYSEEPRSITSDSWEIAFKLLNDIEAQNLKLENQVKGLEQDLEICQTALASKEVALQNSEACSKKWKTTTIVFGTTTITLSIVSTVLTIILVKGNK